MSGVRTTKCMGRTGGRTTDNICPFLGVIEMVSWCEETAAHAPAQLMNFAACIEPLEVEISTALPMERVDRTGVLGRRSIVVARTAARSAEAS